MAPESSFGGVFFGGAETVISLTGSVGMRFEATGIPNVARVSLTNLANLGHAPFTLGGHTIAILSMTMTSQNMLCDLSQTTNNLAGEFSTSYTISINGGSPVTVFESGDMLASFNPSSGVWSEIVCGSTFGLSAVPSLSNWGLALLVLLLLTAATILIRQRVELRPSV